MYLIAIVILNHNGRHILAQFLPSVVQYSSPHPIFLVDSGSTDDSVKFTQQNYPSIHCLRLSKNEGFGKGYNIALKEIKAKYYVLLNSDVAVTPNWITPMLRLMEKNPEIAVCQPKILSWQNQDYFEYAGAAGGLLDKFGYPFCRGRLFSTLERDHGQYNDMREIFWGSGACFFIRSKVFWELDGFDENLWAYYEEIDLCWRIQKKGWKVYYCGYSIVYHLGSATLGHNTTYQTYLKFKNRALILYKHTPQNISIWRNGVRCLLDLLAAINMFFSGKPKHSKAILKANVDFFKQKKQYQPPQKNYALKNIYQGLLPFDYFFKRKKYFTDLDARKFS
jgi:GT2 family glycosyltransferase